MDTSILHERIKEFKAKAKHPVSREMILLFETWFLSLENYVADIEIDNFQLNKRIAELQETISLLCDLIIITGNADLINVPDLKDQNTRKAITLLLKSKDRKNYNHVVAVAGLLGIYPEVEFESIKQLKEHASRD